MTSKEAAPFVKALQQYVETDTVFYAVGFELGNLLSKGLDYRFLTLYDGYQEAKRVGM